MKTRLLSLLLCLCLTASCLIGCSEKAAETPSGADETEAADAAGVPGGDSEADPSSAGNSDALIAVEADYDWKAGVSQNDYGGYEFTILNGCTAS